MLKGYRLDIHRQNVDDELFPALRYFDANVLAYTQRLLQLRLPPNIVVFNASYSTSMTSIPKTCKFFNAEISIQTSNPQFLKDLSESQIEVLVCYEYDSSLDAYMPPSLKICFCRFVHRRRDGLHYEICLMQNREWKKRIDDLADQYRRAL